MLNKYDALPLYVQLERILRQEIMEGTYKNGDIIPSEIQMTQKYGITRTTVRRAISELVNEGLLTQVHGKGTYVCFKEVKYNIWNFGGFTDYITSRGEVPYTSMLDKRIVEYNSKKYIEVKRARGVKKGEDILFLTIDTSRIPLEIFPGIEDYDFSINSIYNIMRTCYGVFPKRAELSMDALISDKEMREIFRLKKNKPLVAAEGIVYDNSNRIVENVRVVYGPNIEFKVGANMEVKPL